MAEDLQDSNQTIKNKLKINHSSISKEEALSKWQRWVPMDRELYEFLRAAQVCMLQKIDEMFTQANIKYWLCGGALIGAIRHGGLIPHDDDIDLECFAHDCSKITAIPLDEPFYTGFVENSGTWEGYPVAKLQFFHGMLEVDIFPRPSPLPTGHRHFPDHKEVFPLNRYSFHNISVWGPNRERCGAYLDRCYGSDWRELVCVYNHDFNWYHLAGFHPRKEVLPADEYNRIIVLAEIIYPKAKESAQATYDRLMSQGFERLSEKYKQYRWERTFRRNRAAAEYRETLQEQREQQRHG